MVLSDFRQLLKSNTFKLAFTLNFLFYLGSIVQLIIPTFFDTDFSVFYNAGGVCLNNISELYDQSNYVYNFRYLPTSALFFIPFFLLGYNYGYILFTTINFVLNILIYDIIIKIIKTFKPENRYNLKIAILISIFACCIPQALNYALLQINLWVSYLTLLSLLLFLKYDTIKTDLLASLLLGLILIIKPTIIIILPFLLIPKDFNENRTKLNKYKTSFIRMIGFSTPFFFNILLFFMYPNLLEGFLHTIYSEEYHHTIKNWSFSLTNVIIISTIVLNISINSFLIFISVFSMFFLIALFLLNSKELMKHEYFIFIFFYGLIVMLISYFDSITHHLLPFIPIFIIVYFVISDKEKKYLKLLYLYLIGFAFLEISSLVLFYLNIIEFNFISTILLILSFYNVSMIIKKSEINN